MTIFFEACAGLGSITLAMFGAKPPCSRIGSKAGYAKEIIEEMDFRPWGKPPENIVLVEQDPAVANALRWLLWRPVELSYAIETHGSSEYQEPREIWLWARKRRIPSPNRYQRMAAAAWWLYTAGARGGIGGFKGSHIRRPNVDGFIPSRASLIERVRSSPVVHDATVLCKNIRDVPIPNGSFIYLDPPYKGAQGFGGFELDRDTVIGLARLWKKQYCRVAISEREPLDIPGARHVNLSAKRRGQTRRSMTTSDAEWLTIVG